jgi:hypothetical protein
VEVELANVQSCLESLNPIVDDHGERIDNLEASRDNVKGMLTVIAFLQGVMITIFIAVFVWALNHVTLHATF